MMFPCVLKILESIKIPKNARGKPGKAEHPPERGIY